MKKPSPIKWILVGLRTEGTSLLPVRKLPATTSSRTQLSKGPGSLEQLGLGALGKGER
jgi:hypothetical protein